LAGSHNKYFRFPHSTPPPPTFSSAPPLSPPLGLPNNNITGSHHCIPYVNSDPLNCLNQLSRSIPTKPLHHSTYPLSNPSPKQPWQSPTMARNSTSTFNSSSSNSPTTSTHSGNYYDSSNVRASCYAVDACTTAIHGFHYSTTGAGGVDWCS